MSQVAVHVLVLSSCPRETLLSSSSTSSEALITLKFSDERYVFGRLEEVLVMGLRMTEGINHEVNSFYQIIS